MKISLNQIRSFNRDEHTAGDPAPNGLDELLTSIGAQLGAVEDVVHVGDMYDDILVVKIVSCEDHPNADRLHVCMIDDGGKARDVERNESGLVQVVCGAPNAREGIKVVWLPPGSTVPASFGDEPFVLEVRPLRGVVSNGMLASPKELAVGDNHDGILEVEDDVGVGSLFAEVYDLNGDVIIDMENKMFTHRPDCFGVIGVAREIAGIQRQPFKSPEWYRHNVSLETSDGDLKVEVVNEIPEVVPRFVVLPMSNVTIKPSPVWLQVSLSRLGVRQINNVVDLTNYYMLLTGQPLHAYDYDKVVAQDDSADSALFTIRYPKADEKLLLLSGKEIEPRSEAIMIATRDKAIGLGGVMGGGDTEVDESTKNIILECANFDMYSIRRTSMASGVFTDAVTRFNKGQSPLQNVAVIKRIAEDVAELAGGRIAGKLVDDNHISQDVIDRGYLEDRVELSRDFINLRLGFDLSAQEMSRLLENVEFDVEIKDNNLSVAAPFWRTDIAIPEDVVEEVGRLYGFDHLPVELPCKDLTPASPDPLLSFKAKLRSILSRAGANEVLGYSFVHGRLLQKARQGTENAYQIANALSPDLQYYRNTLTPSLLERVTPNIRAGYEEFALFEVNKTHIKSHGVDDDGLPKEIEMLGFVYAVSDKLAEQKVGAAYYQAKHYLEYLASKLGIKLEYKKYEDDAGRSVTQPFDNSRSALVMISGTEEILGVVGEYHRDVSKSLKLPRYAAGFEVSVEMLLEYSGGHSYEPLSRYPKVERDICLQVDSSTDYSDLAEFAQYILPKVLPEDADFVLKPIDIYKPEAGNNKNITLRIVVNSSLRTLTAEEINNSIDKLAAEAAAKLNAERL